MRGLLKSFVPFMVFLCPNIHAKQNIACSSVQWEPVTSKKKVYTFSVSQICKMEKTEDLPLDDLKNYLADIHKADAEQVIEELAIDCGQRLILAKKVTTDHGTLSFETQDELSACDNTLLKINSRSTKVSGTGKTKLTKGFSDHITFTQNQDVLLIKYIKKTSIEKLRHYPEMIFVPTVKKKVAAELTKNAQKYNDYLQSYLR